MHFLLKKFDWRIEIERVYYIVIIFASSKNPVFLSFVFHYMMFIAAHADMIIGMYTLFWYVAHERKKCFIIE